MLYAEGLGQAKLTLPTFLLTCLSLESGGSRRKTEDGTKVAAASLTGLGVPTSSQNKLAEHKAAALA